MNKAAIMVAMMIGRRIRQRGIRFMVPYKIGKTCEVSETSQVFRSSYGTTTGQLLPDPGLRSKHATRPWMAGLMVPCVVM